jgi:hypothetical protein
MNLVGWLLVCFQSPSKRVFIDSFGKTVLLLLNLIHFFCSFYPHDILCQCLISCQIEQNWSRFSLTSTWYLHAWSQQSWLSWYHWHVPFHVKLAASWCCSRQAEDGMWRQCAISCEDCPSLKREGHVAVCNYEASAAADNVPSGTGRRRHFCRSNRRHGRPRPATRGGKG